MRQISCEHRGFAVPTRRLNASDDLSRPNHIDQSAVRPLCAPTATETPTALSPTSHPSRHAGAVALASRPQSTSALISNPHSARC